MTRETAYNDVFDAQVHFRLLMDSMARPGKINLLNGVSITPPGSLNAASALVGLALLNADVTFFADRDADAITRYFRVNTASLFAEADQADFLFLSGTNGPQYLEMAGVGSLTYPDTGASVILDTGLIHDESTPDTQFSLTLKGPGVNGTKTIFIGGLNADLLDTIRAKNTEYPLGIDIILTDTGGRIVCLPRTTHCIVHRL